MRRSFGSDEGFGLAGFGIRFFGIGFRFAGFGFWGRCFVFRDMVGSVARFCCEVRRGVAVGADWVRRSMFSGLSIGLAGVPGGLLRDAGIGLNDGWVEA
jgi:hypothetical protein